MNSSLKSVISLEYQIVFSRLIPSISSDGSTYNHIGDSLTRNASVKDGDEWSMEVDLRSSQRKNRTLRWFINGKQQRLCIKGVPDTVEFGV